MNKRFVLPVLPLLGLTLLGNACSGVQAVGEPGTVPGPTPASITPSSLDGDAADPAAVITARSFRSHLYFLASDAMRGRDTPSPELEVAAAYLASQHQMLGLEGGAEGGSFYQRWPYRQLATDMEGVRVAFQGSGGTVTLRPGEGAAFRGGVADELNAELTFVGMGRQLPAAEGLAGRAAVISIPGEPNRSTLAMAGRVSQWAEAGGAVALVVVLDAGVSRAAMETFSADVATPGWRMGWDFPLPQIFLTREVAERAIPGLGEPLRQAAGSEDGFIRPLPGARLTGTVPAQVLEDGRPANVVALLRGRDATLRNEYVVLSAHYDHVGVGRPIDGDSIYNGADDNASGTVGLLEVARAIAGMPERPRRSILFVHVSGEEKGLLGSRWFVDNAPVPVESMVANINVDMIGGDAHADSLIVIGKDYSDLGPLVDRLNDGMPELGLVTSDDLWPEQRFFFRSDQLNFMRKEIPALFFFTGVHECYHRPCDTVDNVTHEKAANISRLLVHTTLELANRDARPQWRPEGLAEVRQLIAGGR